MVRAYRRGDELDDVLLPYARMIFPGINIRAEGEASRNGFNFYPLSQWGASRGFILKLGRIKYRFRYSVHLRRVLHGWERAA
jgi:hypothetical protein